MLIFLPGTADPWKHIENGPPLDRFCVFLCLSWNQGSVPTVVKIQAGVHIMALGQRLSTVQARRQLEVAVWYLSLINGCCQHVSIEFTGRFHLSWIPKYLSLSRRTHQKAQGSNCKGNHFSFASTFNRLSKTHFQNERLYVSQKVSQSSQFRTFKVNLHVRITSTAFFLPFAGLGVNTEMFTVFCVRKRLHLCTLDNRKILSDLSFEYPK